MTTAEMITTQASLIQSKSRPTVLIADDKEMNRTLYSEVLKDEGYRLLTAENGQQALELIRANSIDLALVDVMMPKMNGMTLCSQIKADPATRLLPVVLITGYAAQHRVNGIERGADAYLSKPIDNHELIAQIRSLIRVKRLTDDLESAETVLFTLARSIEAKDVYTEGHCNRLSTYSAALGARIKLPDSHLIALRRGGIVHDIGKVCVPEHILLKPGPLTREEWAIMKQHPSTGEQICAPLKSFALVLPIIRHHHEKLDGSGYPDGLKGEQIPLLARILTIVDVYDAITTDRPYRTALPPQDAFALMWREVNRGWWDGTLLAEFEQLIKDTMSVSGRKQ